jgi:hypothetical protein
MNETEPENADVINFLTTHEICHKSQPVFLVGCRAFKPDESTRRHINTEQTP